MDLNEYMESRGRQVLWCGHTDYEGLLDDACDELDRLRAEADAMREAIGKFCKDCPYQRDPFDGHEAEY